LSTTFLPERCFQRKPPFGLAPCLPILQVHRRENFRQPLKRSLSLSAPSADWLCVGPMSRQQIGDNYGRRDRSLLRLLSVRDISTWYICQISSLPFTPWQCFEFLRLASFMGTIESSFSAFFFAARLVAILPRPSEPYKRDFALPKIVNSPRATFRFLIFLAGPFILKHLFSNTPQNLIGFPCGSGVPASQEASNSLWLPSNLSPLKVWVLFINPESFFSRFEIFQVRSIPFFGFLLLSPGFLSLFSVTPYAV